jgi:hypothetical protein
MRFKSGRWDGRRRYSLFRDDRGIALVVAISMLAALALLGTTGYIITTLEVKTSGNYRTGVQALYAAEAGVNRLLGYYLNNTSDYSNQSTAGDMGFATSRPSSANFGDNMAYWFTDITYGSGSPPSYVVITSHGAVIGSESEAVIEAKFNAQTSGSSVFDYAIFAQDEIEMTGSSYVDSYNSANAPWSSEGEYQNGNIGTNATGSGVVELKGSTKVYGNALIGPGGNTVTGITTTGSAAITGSKSTLSETKDMTPMDDPGGGTSVTINMSGSSSKTITAGTYRATKVKMSGSSKLYISGDVTLYVDDYFKMTGSSEVYLNAGASLTVYVSGDLRLTGSGLINTDHDPTKLIFYGTSSCEMVKITGSTDFYGAIHAPEAEIDITGSGDIYGALVGEEVDISGSRGIHYDENLQNVGGGSSSLTGFTGVYWKESF